MLKPWQNKFLRPDCFSQSGFQLFKKAFNVLLATSLFVPQLQLWVLAETVGTTAPGAVQGQISISREVAISSSKEKVSLNLRDANIRDLLNMLAKQGNFNIIVDESVEGTLTVDIKDIPINKALEYIFTLGQLSYTKDGNTVIVASEETALNRNLTAKTFKAIPVLYKNAAIIAGQLTNTILRVQRPSGNRAALVSADLDTNSLLVLGTDSDIRLIGDALRELDVPRNRKVYHIRHNTPAHVAQVLAANFFATNNMAGGGMAGGMAGGGMAGGMAGGGMAGGMAGGGMAGGMAGGGMAGGMAGGGMAGGGMAGGMAGGGMAGGAAGGMAGGAAGGLSTFTVGGVTFIPEPISATLTVLATDEQLGLIDSIIEQVDVRRPQVAIEVSLVEIQDSSLKNMVPTWDSFNFGRIARLSPLGSGGGNLLELASPFTKQKLQLSRPETFTNTVSLSYTSQNLRGKILANPTIVTMDNTSASISITDQVPTISQSNTIVNGSQTITTTITTQEAGVTVELTPQIFNDGSVLLSLQPEVSQPVRTVTATSGSGASATTTSTVLLATRSMDISGVRVQDGETLVIGGLLRETAQTDISRVPGLDKLPIVSAMFRATNSNNKEKTELVLMVTPHILKEEAVSYFTQPQANTRKPTSLNHGHGGLQPVSLPKFMGATPALKPPAGSDQEQPVQSAPEANKSGSQSTSASPAIGGASSLPKVGQVLQDAKKAFADPPAKAESRADALKSDASPLSSSLSRLGKQSRKTKGDRVYEKAPSRPEILNSLEEILKN
jgi:type II secretory pathway component GspD/PulD (secretin)